MRKKLKNQKISHYSYGRYGLNNYRVGKYVKRIRAGISYIFDRNWVWGVALALMSLCRPGDEILVSDNVYGPTKEISEKLLREFNIIAKFYNPDSFDDLKNKVSNKNDIS